MMTLEADSVNVQALDMGHIVVDIDGVNITELINRPLKTVIHSAWWMTVTLPKHRQLMPALTSCCKTMQ